MYVSVIVPVFNGEKTIGKCLAALFNQSYVGGYEIIVVDDCSTDRTTQIVSSYKVRLLRHRSNRGPAAARNTGIKSARGRVIVFTDADCIPGRNFIEKHVQFHQKHTNSVCIGKTTLHPAGYALVPRFLEFGSLTLFDYRKLSYLEKKTSPARIPNRKNAWPYFFFYTPNLSAPKKIFKSNPFDEEFRYAAFDDIELGLRLWEAGVPFFYFPDIKVYHFHPKTISRLILRSERAGQEQFLAFKKRRNRFLPLDLKNTSIVLLGGLNSLILSELPVWDKLLFSILHLIATYNLYVGFKRGRAKYSDP